MLATLYLIAIVLAPAWLSRVIADQRDRNHLFMVIFGAGVLSLIALWLVNDTLPFAGGGDDQDYFQASQRTFHSVRDWFDLGQFRQTHRQAGYPFILTWVYQLAGNSLFHKKALNVLFFLMLAQVWFVIGQAIGGRRLAFAYVWGVLLTTPLWFYWMFLLKDMAIVLLQSLLLLGLVLSRVQGKQVRGYSIAGLSTLLVLSFRSMLALPNLAMLALSILLRQRDRIRALSTLGRLTIVASIAIGILAIGASADFLLKLGVSGPDRTLDAASVEAGINFRRSSRMALGNPLKFLLVYLVGGEFAAFNPQSWQGDGVLLLRAITIVPWAYVGLPLFLAGTYRLMTAVGARTNLVRSVTTKRREMVSIDVQSLWLFVAFIVLYGVISWLAGDPTRVRISTFPPMVAIAGLAWVTLSNQKRIAFLLIWGCAISFALLVYYAVLK